MRIGVWANCPFMRYSPFLDFTHPSVVDSYRRFGITYRSQLKGSSSPRKLPLSIIPKEGKSHWHCGGFLKYPLFISDFSRHFNVRTDFLWPPNTNFCENIFDVLNLLRDENKNMNLKNSFSENLWWWPRTWELLILHKWWIAPVVKSLISVGYGL